MASGLGAEAQFGGGEEAVDDVVVATHAVVDELVAAVGAMILLRVKPGFVRQTANALVTFSNVRFVSLSFGKGGVVKQTLHKDVADLHHFVSETNPEAAPEVVSTETLQLAEILKSSWTWDDWFEYLHSDAQEDDPQPNEAN